MTDRDENREPLRAFDAEAGLPEDLLRLGESVARLPRPEPPAGLAARTVERIEREGRAAPARKRSWWRQPITNPYARVAAALALAATLGVLTNLDTAERLGRLSERLIGAKTTDGIEHFVDRVLLAYGPVEVREQDFNRLVGGEGLPQSPRSLRIPLDRRQERPSTQAPTGDREA